ncbi:3-phenylpropionate/trans-cinnamate dioxygenase ferredoxin reductase subunit [Rhodococcus sp. 27YEA15]|uniref:NAD(P)/FAD-dependent oxidoreductase n=1 Tax=Rhodococcus sp. 27YEA15 TaxID=3156259 RepID=UPI003C79D96A
MEPNRVPAPTTISVNTLIIGAGQAGHTIAMTMRRLGHGDSIAIVGAEQHAPYTRPPLSKAFLLGQVEPEDFALGGFDALASAEITAVFGETVSEATAPTADNAGRAVTDAGTVFEFRQLALATGGSPVHLDVPGATLPGVHQLRTLEDANALRSALTTCRRLVIVGGGFIGLEAAAVARSLGIETDLIETSDRLMSRVVTSQVSEMCARAHTARGVKVHLSTRATAFHGTDHVTEVELETGERLPADAILVSVGMRAQSSLARGLGLATGRGILVDEAARTSNPLICAAGDCTEFHHQAAPGGGRISLESTQNAIDQARTAAATLAGKPAFYKNIPWFWSDQGDWKIQIAGWAADHDDHLILGDPADQQCSVIYFRDNRLIAIHAINRPADYTAVRRALTRGATVTRESFTHTEELPAELHS